MQPVAAKLQSMELNVAYGIGNGVADGAADGVTKHGMFATADGGRLAYAVAGRGDPLVFLHGFGVDMSMWQAQWPVFSERYRTVRYDLRGFGASSLATGPYSHVDDFLALTGDLKARPAHLVGLSYGGRLALRIAIEEPSAVRSLTLADTALDGYRWSEQHTQSWRRMNTTGRRDVAQAKSLWLEHELFGPARAQPATTRALAAMIERYSGWHFQNKDPEVGPRRAGADELRTIRAPTLVMVGEQDLPDFQSIARLVAAAVPHASLQVMPGCGHLSNLENADAFNQLVLTHLRQAEDRARL
jgi:pimeloyl-ACP methyl ester carboxylesterase